MNFKEYSNFRFNFDRTFEQFTQTQLTSEYSPTIPLDFPQNLIPSFFIDK